MRAHNPVCRRQLFHRPSWITGNHGNKCYCHTHTNTHSFWKPLESVLSQHDSAGAAQSLKNTLMSSRIKMQRHSESIGLSVCDYIYNRAFICPSNGSLDCRIIWSHLKILSYSEISHWPPRGAGGGGGHCWVLSCSHTKNDRGERKNLNRLYRAAWSLLD